ncbi:hypothetical protein GCM10010289_80540 [Streptomyces violascens]|nr:hypothetical protein GCM10010289_80540 [Streptomyces violascens]
MAARRHHPAGLSSVLATAAPASAAAAPRPCAAPGPARTPPADIARDELGDLNVEAPHAMTGYTRTKFPHWATQYGQCDTREVVLQRDGHNVAQDDKCRAVQGPGSASTTGRR